jgi:hypothetical protein
MLSKEETEDRVGFTIPQDYWNFVPWGNRLLVRRFPKDKMTMGGLIIPNSAQKAKAMGYGGNCSSGPHCRHGI